MTKKKVKRDDLVYPNLSYDVVGVLFEVGDEVGFGHKEKFYQRALAKAFRDHGFQFEEQMPVKLKYKDENVGTYYFDFCIEDKLVLEIKTRNYFSKRDIEQLYRYLKACNLKLGIIAHFTRDGVKFTRVVNL